MKYKEKLNARNGETNAKALFKTGGGALASKYWLNKGQKLCRLSEKEEETNTHIFYNNY